MPVHEIARRLVGGIWRTVDAEEDSNGGSQPFELLGPFTFNYNDANIGSTGIEAFALDAGTVVLSAFAIQKIAFDGGDSAASVQIGLGPAATWAGGDWSNLQNYFGDAGVVDGFELAPYGDARVSVSIYRAATLAVPSVLLVYGDPGGGTYIAGQGDLYALVTAQS